MTDDTDDRAADAALLRVLHEGPAPLVLANAWDVASARAVVVAGFPVVATSSAAVAESLGYADDDSMPPDEAFAAIARIARAVDVPVTADVEAGYQLPPGELVERLLGAGAVGCNLEDTDHHGRGVLVDADRHAERLAAVKQAAPDLVLNARVDVFARGDGDLVEAVRRGRLYREAGADCVYPIVLADEGVIASFVAEVGGPVNILVRPGAPTVERLAELGVRRVSLGSGLFRAAMRTVADEAARLRPS